VGCERVGELAKGGAVVSRQGQGWMGIRTTSKEAGSPSKETGSNREAKGWVEIKHCLMCKYCNV
jgi:hypothetical protein